MAHTNAAAAFQRLAWTVLFGLASSAALAQAQQIEVENALVRLIEQIDVPAQEAGVLSKVTVREGQMIQRGDLIAQIEDSQTRLARDQARLEVEIAARKASNDVTVRYARKALDVARAELKRAVESAEKFNKAVSQTELDRLRLTVERGTLEIENAEHELAIEKFTQNLRRNELKLAEVNLERRQILAPLAGFVDQINRRAGEWVEPGTKVVRILRIDQLRAEGFLDAQLGTEGLVGRKVALVVAGADGKSQTYGGQLVYVSPEIDPVNRQVRVWAEIDNHDLKLRPGQRATLLIKKQ